MAQIKIGDVLDTLKHLAAAAFARRNDPTYWEAVRIDETTHAKTELKVIAASVEPTSISLTLQADDGTPPFTVEARPTGKNSAVSLDGTLDPEARLVYKPVWGSVVGRFHLDFRPLSLGGHEVRINTAFPTRN